MKRFMIGIAGGSGSGKSTVTEHIINTIGITNVAVVVQDNYYRDLSNFTLEQRRKFNLDHPDAFDWELLSTHLEDLYHGEPIKMPTYDYTRYSRLERLELVPAASVIIFEGIFALVDEELRKRMAMKVFVDTAPDIRFIRRLQRDIAERGRSVESVIEQYLEFVRPMYKKFVDPTRRYADIIIPHGANKVALEMIVARIKAVSNS